MANCKLQDRKDCLYRPLRAERTRRVEIQFHGRPFDSQNFVYLLYREDFYVFGYLVKIEKSSRHRVFYGFEKVFLCIVVYQSATALYIGQVDFKKTPLRKEKETERERN